jgi:hypothetical protein
MIVSRYLHLLRALRGSTARPGQSLVIAALSFTALMGMVALGVDIGNLWLQQRTLRTIADGAALVGAQGYQDISGSWPVSSDGLDAAKNYAEARAGVPCGFGAAAPEPCKIISPVAAYGGEGGQYIQVVIQKTVPFSFARVLGFASQDLTLTSTARTNRPQPSDFAIIAIGTALGDGIQIQQAGGPSSLGNYRITQSDVASHSGITQFGGVAGTLYVMSGQAHYQAGSPVTASVNPAPVPQGNMSNLAADPFSGSSWPSAVCDPRPNTPTEVFGGSVSFGYLDSDGNKNVVTFNPGCYTSIDIQGGTAIFRDGVYLVTGNLNASPPDPGVRDVPIMRMETPLSSSAGMYMEVRGATFNINNFVKFELKGRQNARGVLFHATSTTGTVSINNLYNSSLLGSVYAPNMPVVLRGNACDSLNASEDCTTTAPRSSRIPINPSNPGGGQVVAKLVRLVLVRSTFEMSVANCAALGLAPADCHWLGDAWGIDFLPRSNQRQPAPTLVPATP